MKVIPIEPKKTISWAETLRSLEPGISYRVPANYKETTSIRSIASRLKSEKGLVFSVRKEGDDFTIIRLENTVPITKDTT